MENRAPLDLRRTARHLLLLALVSGCSSGGIQPASIPPEHMAPPVVSGHRVDLSRFSAAGDRANIVHPGDLLTVTISTGVPNQPPDEWSVRIDESGFADLPLIGKLPLAGLELSDADERIRQLSIDRGIFRNPVVALAIEQRQTFHITVAGAVEEPGVYELSPNQSDLVAALVAAGGLTDQAGQFATIRQGTVPLAGTLSLTSYPDTPHDPSFENVQRIDLVGAANNPHQPIMLRDGSVVTIAPQTPGTIAVMGLVKKPDQYVMSMERDTYLLDAIAMAGGRTTELADDVKVIRQTQYEGKPLVIDVSVAEAKQNRAANIRLAAGDVVSVEETPVTFVSEVVRNFFRIGITAPAF